MLTQTPGIDLRWTRRALLCTGFALAALATTGDVKAQTKDRPSVAASYDLFSPDNLLAWCIVPFDRLNRGPHERVAMLKRLGFKQYAWDWRDEHLKDLPTEIRVAQENGIRLRAIWIWIEKDKDVVGKLSEGNRTVLAAVKNAGISVDYWIGFHENFFEGRDDADRIAQGAAMVAYVARLAGESNSTVSLYNHGGWFGESKNQIAILHVVNDRRVGMVYNFHHAHHEIGEFAQNLRRMLPYLRAVNINGMNPAGPKILPIGSGTDEAQMLKILVASGYHGPVGILGHVAEADVEDVLRKNLDGLHSLVRTLQTP